MNPTKKQKTLPPSQQEVADSVVHHPSTELMNCENKALELIAKHIKTNNPDEFYANRTLSTRWYQAFHRVAETDKVTTLCLMPDSTKPTSEELKSRFIRDIDIDSAVNIRHNIEAPAGPDPEDIDDFYPNVTQLFISGKYFSGCWCKNLTHLSLFEDKSVQSGLKDYSPGINDITSLRSLDLNGYFFIGVYNLKHTLARLEHLSVNFTIAIESYRELVAGKSPPGISYFAMLNRYLPKCTRFWFVQHVEPCSLHYWEKLDPEWIPKLTHFGMNIFQNEKFKLREESQRIELSNCTLARFVYCREPALQVLHLLDSIVSLNPQVVGHIAGLTNLEELNLGVKYHHVELYKAFKRGTLKSWNKVHTLDLTIRRVIKDGPGFCSVEITEIISTLVPNVKHLSLSFTNYYDNHPFTIVIEDHLFEELPGAFTELLSFKINHGRSLFYEGKRNELGEPFVTTMTRKAQIMLARHMMAPGKPRDPILDEYVEEEVDEESEDEEETEEEEVNDNDHEGEEADEEIEEDDEDREEEEDEDDYNDYDDNEDEVEQEMDEEIEDEEE